MHSTFVDAVSPQTPHHSPPHSPSPSVVGNSSSSSSSSFLTSSVPPSMPKPKPGTRTLSLLPSPPSSSPPHLVSVCRPPSVRVTGTKQLLRLIARFIRGDRFRFGSVDLEILSVDHKAHLGFLRELQHPRILTGKEVDSLRYDYTPETSVLTVPCMPTPVHEGSVGASIEMIMDMRDANFLSRTERMSIQLDTGGDVALPTLRSLTRTNSKGGGTAVKQPDAAYYFTDHDSPTDSDRCPRVVFEIAFSQSYESVRQDAEHWLLRAQGSVKLVVLVKLFEGSHPEAEVDEEEIEKKAAEQRLALGVDDESSEARSNSEEADSTEDAESSKSDRSEHISQPDVDDQGPDDLVSGPSTGSSQSSTNELYDGYFKNPSATWVGPITGFIELYRYDAAAKCVYQDGLRCDIFDPPADTELHPKMNISDLLPDEHIEGDRTRSFTFPLHRFKSHIAVGVLRLMANRRARHEQLKRKRKGDDQSGQFKPEQEGAEQEEEAEEEEEEEEGREVPKRRKRNVR